MNGKRAGLLGRVTTRMAVGMLAVAVVLIAATDVSYAYYSSTGTGTGTAVTGTATITLGPPAATVAGLFPGDTVTGVTVNVTNSTAASVVLKTAVTGTILINLAVGATGTPCLLGDVSFVPDALPAGVVTHGQSVPVTGTVTMSTAAGNQCQGATFSIPLTVTAQAG